MTFEQLGLRPETLRVLTELNFIEPTPIQEQSIPKLIAGDIDMMGLAQTGTGKTAAFALPILEKIDEKNRKPQALIMCPTRELCMQITSDFEKFMKYYPQLRVVAVYGGASIGMQIKDLRRGVQIVVATPGRLQDIIDRGEINFEDVKITVLDEADEMLNMGFKEAITEILSNTPDEKNIWLFTATMPKDIKSIAKKYMTDPIEVSVSVNKSNENIEHQYYLVNPRDRYATLKRIVDYYPEIFGIVFCRTKNETKEVADQLIRDGYNSDALHGDLTQQQRDIVMNRYRERSLQLLIATDVAARGIDVSNVTHVINYALPDDSENYTHRSGRTARAGKKGISISLVTKREMGKVFEIERIISKKFEQIQVPTGNQVCEKQLLALIQRAKEVEVNEEHISPFMEKINAEFESMDKEEVIKRFASMEFNRFLEYYQNTHDLNVREERRDRNDRGERSEGRNSRFGERNERSYGDRAPRERNAQGGINAQEGYTRFFINLGSLDRMDKGGLLRIVCDATNVRGNSIGRIDMKDKFSFFEVEDKFKNDILKGVQNLDVNGRQVRVDVAGEGSKEGGLGGFRSERPARDFGNRDNNGPRREFGNRSNSGGRDFGNRSNGGGRRDFGNRSSDGNRDFNKTSGGFSSRSPKKDDSFKLDFKFDGDI